LHHKIKKMMRKLNLINVLVFLLTINLFAQETDSLKARKAQVSFAYPVGSNGKSALNYSNNFSFNILYGLNGGLNGVEIGSLLNFNKGKVKGFQLSGIINYNTQKSSGILLSGISNICRDSSSGILVSGVLNYSKSNSKGFQMATINIATNEYKGIQFGVINFAKKLKGIQFGVINLLENSENAIPIGLFTIVKKGYYEFEITGGEALFANLNFKMGVEKFYTIYKVAFATFNNKPVYGFGVGFGRNISLTNKQKLSIDLSSNQIVYNNKWNNDLNLLNKADFNYKYSITKKCSVLIGPSFNVYTTKDKVEGKYGTINIPYTIYTNQWDKGKLIMWFGLNAGLSLKL